MSYCFNEDYLPADTILEALSEARVVDFELEDDKLVIVEKCDGYFGADLNKEQALQLLKELTEIVGQMK